MERSSNIKTVDEYLLKLDSWHRFMSLKDRDIALHEVREHLESLVRSAEEAGLTHDEAVKNALDQFGDPDVIGPDIERDSKRIFWTLPQKIALIAWLLFMVFWWFFLSSDIKLSLKFSWEIPVGYGFLIGFLEAIRLEYLRRKRKSVPMPLEEYERRLRRRYNQRVADGFETRGLAVVEENNRRLLKQYKRELRNPLSRLNYPFFGFSAIFFALIMLCPPSYFRAFMLYQLTLQFVTKIMTAVIKQKNQQRRRNTQLA